MFTDIVYLCNAKAVQFPTRVPIHISDREGTVLQKGEMERDLVETN